MGLVLFVGVLPTKTQIRQLRQLEAFSVFVFSLAKQIYFSVLPTKIQILSTIVYNFCIRRFLRKTNGFLFFTT